MQEQLPTTVGMQEVEQCRSNCRVHTEQMRIFLPNLTPPELARWSFNKLPDYIQAICEPQFLQHFIM